MAKNPNRSPEKGFIKDISKAYQAKPAPEKKAFVWGKPASGVAPKAEPMGVPRRIADGKAAGRPKSNIAAEAAQIVAKRRG